MGIEAVANLLGLDFVNIGTENYDIAMPRQYLNDERVQAVLALLRSSAFKQNIEQLGGYEIGAIELVAVNG